jgi:hypothetical protein
MSAGRPALHGPFCIALGAALGAAENIASMFIAT